MSISVGSGATPTRIRAVAYARVSTVRQAETELSLDEQLRKVGAFAELRDAEIVENFIDRGLSGTTETRSEFQRMVKFACNPTNAVKLVLVYNFSRFFRNVTAYLKYRDLFEQAGVKLLSATQDIPEGAAGKLMETLLAAFDGHSSEVNSIAVKDMMAANAAAGFWNGARAPYGYRIVDAVKVGSKIRKKIEIDLVEEPVVHQIFDLCLSGSGAGPMGLKKIAAYLNGRGVLQRGKPWMTSDIERILKSETYIGTCYFNKRDSRTRNIRPPSQWIAIAVPPIVTREVFDAVGAALIARRPSNTAPRVVSGPTLLTGIARCGCCCDSTDGSVAGMMLRTGKSGQYRYLVCARRALRSVNACDAPQIPMEAIDEVVISAVEQIVLEPVRLRELVSGMVASNENALANLDSQIARARQAASKAEAGLRNLFAMIASAPDTFSVGDPELRDQVDLLKRQKSEMASEVNRLTDRRKLSQIEVSDEMLASFGKGVRQRLRVGEPAFRRAWLHHFVSEVIVGKTWIRIRIAKEPIILGATEWPRPQEPPVPSFARKWRARNDSNVRPSDS
jgi:site-specific DNA recombinase